MQKRFLSVAMAAVMLGSAATYLPVTEMNICVTADSIPTITVDGLVFEISWDIEKYSDPYADPNSKYTLLSGKNITESILDIPSVVNETHQVIAIGSYAFRGNTALTEVTIPDTVQVIENGAFAGCSNLRKVTAYAKSCTYSKNAQTFPIQAVLCGKEGSFLQSYAKWNGRTFYNLETGETVKYEADQTLRITLGLNGDLNEMSLALALIPYSYKVYPFVLIIPATVSNITPDGFLALSDLENLKAIEVEEGHPKYYSLNGALYEKETNKLLYDPQNEVNIISSGSIGENAEYSFASDGVLTLSGTGTVDTYNRPWESYKDKIRSIVVKEGITGVGYESMGNGLFRGCTALTDVTLPEGLKTIGQYAFENCGLLDIQIPDSVTKIGPSAFENCAKLKKINVDSQNDSYASIDGVLYNKELTEAILIPYGHTGQIEIPASLDKMQLTKPAPDWYFEVDKENQQYSSVDGTLYDKAQTVLYYVPTSVSEIFVLPSTVKTISANAFQFAVQITSLTLSRDLTPSYFGMNGESVEKDDIGSALSRLVNLKQIILPVENENYVLLDGVLYNRDMTAIRFYPPMKTEREYRIPESVTEISGVLNQCSNLETIIFPKHEFSIHFAFNDCSGLTEVTIPSTCKLVEGAFKNCNNLQTVTISEGCQEISGNAFSNCEKMTDVYILNDNIIMNGTSDVYFSRRYTRDYNSWSYSVTGVTIHGHEGSSAERYALMNSFKFDCLPSQTVTTTVPQETTVATTETTVTTTPETTTIPVSTKPVPQQFGDLTYQVNDDHIEIVGCDRNAVQVNIPAEIDGIPVTKIAYVAFSRCKKIESIAVPKSVTEIGGMAFSDTQWIKNIMTRTDNFTGAIVNGILVEIEMMETIAIPEGVTAISPWLGYMEYNLIKSWDKPVALTIPESVEKIDDNAFCFEISEISGFEGSAAERYAQEHDIPFKSIGVKQNLDAEPGDLNADGAINLKDVVLLRRFIAGGWDVEISESTADINEDGTINLKDVVLLRRRIAGGWD